MLLKRIFDFVLAVVLLICSSWFLLVAVGIAAFDTGSSGLFLQTRVGQCGKAFKIIKIRTMHLRSGKISSVGSFLRKYKIDELPQFINIILGDMSFVGPRPDIFGYYDQLQGADREVLSLKPGLTSPAALRFKDEELILRTVSNSLEYNDNIIFPEKVRMNLDYFRCRNLLYDIKILFLTVLLVFRRST